MSSGLQPTADRYSRQILFSGIGREGQSRLAQSRILIVGCGALGTAQAESLARAGVGPLRIVDRDFFEFSNLQRESIVTERGPASRLPKGGSVPHDLGRMNLAMQVEA